MSDYTPLMTLKAQRIQIPFGDVVLTTDVAALFIRAS
jgi:hypothetical protein